MSFRHYNPNIVLRHTDIMSTYVNVSHHLANNDDFWSELFVNGKDVNETEGEDHVVHTQDIPAKSIRPVEHPTTQ